MRRAAVLLVLLALPARADTHIWGIPRECQLSVVECDPRPDAATRAAPRVLSSVFMQDSWTIRGYEPSPDGATLLVPLLDGLRVVRGGRADDYALPCAPGWRDVAWHPDSERAALWVKAAPPGGAVARRALAVLDVTRLPRGPVPAGARPPLDLVLRSQDERAPFGLVWSQDGRLYTVATEHDRDTNRTSGVLTHVDLSGRPARDILRTPGRLDFVRSPDARVGPPLSERLLVGSGGGGLFVLGEGLQGVADLPSGGLYNLAWSLGPDHDRVLLYYRKAIQGRSGQTYKGVWLVDLGPSAGPPEELHDRTDVHTLWFSPRGTFATWGTPRDACYRAPDAQPADTVRVTIPTLDDGEDPLIKGVAWSPDEARLAITAGNRLYVHEVATKALTVVAEVGTMDDTFTAQPTWIGDRVVLSAYEDAVKSRRVQPEGPVFQGARPPAAPRPPKR